jgi:long-chain acyl-CoA synthetase
LRGRFSLQLLTDFLQPGKVIFRKKEYGPEIIMAGIESIACYLKDNLVSDSPFVYLFATNHIKTVFSYFGIIKARRICIIMDPKIGKFELSETLLDTPPAACIRIDKTTETFDFAKEIEIRNQPWKNDSGEDLSDVCTMIYTAAEDGFAKGVMLTHENMLANARAIVEVDAISDKTISFALMHFNHLFALQVGIIAPFIVHGGIVVEDISDLINMSSLSGKISEANVTNFYSVPIVYFLFTKVDGIKDKIKNVESFVSGGYKLSEDLFQRFLNKTNREIHEGYGLSEASPICTWHQRNDQIKIQSIGRSFPCCEVTIIQNGNSNTYNQQGEICIRGANVMKGYYRHCDATKNTLAGGWLHSGDWGYKDKDGYVYFNGLKKRMINYAGKKVYPSEVERYIKFNTNVLEAKVFGRDDKLSGQTVNAKIRLEKNISLTQNAFLKWCHKNISNYKVPSKVEFI